MKRFSPFFPGTLALILVAIAVCFGLGGCASTPTTPPTQNQQLLIDTAIDVAVAVAIQNGSSDQAVWTTRANQIVHITAQLQAVAADDSATIQTVTDALKPLLLKAQLSPPELIAANRLIAVLTSEIQVRIDPNSPQIVLIRQVLTEVNSAASVYIISNS